MAINMLLQEPLKAINVSYRAVLQEPGPHLHREASSGSTGHIWINNSGVDQSREVGADGGQVAAVRQPWRGTGASYYSDQRQSRDYSSVAGTHIRRKHGR